MAIILAVCKRCGCICAHIANTYGIAIESMAVVAQSVGGVIAAAWVHDYAPNIRCLVLLPSVKGQLYVPFARSLLTLTQSLV